MTDSDLNNLVHETADAIEKLAPGVTLDRYDLNDMLSAYLDSVGIAVVEDSVPA